MIAEKIKNLTGFAGEAALYQVSPAMECYDGERHEFVIVSAAIAPMSGPETYIFPATEDGEIANWGEMPGSFRGALCHETALNNAGYDIGVIA